MKTTDGAVIDAQRFSIVDGNNNDFKIKIMSDNSGYTIFGKDSSSNKVIICNYLYISTISSQCKYIQSIFQTARGQIMISDDEFFFLGRFYLSPYSFRAYKFTFSKVGVDWAMQMPCSSGPCSMSLCESVAFNSQLYTYFSYGATPKLYFVSFSLNSGSILSSRYKSNFDCNHILGIANKDQYIVSTPICSASQYLLLYNVDSDKFLIKQYASSHLYQCIADPSSGRFIITGMKSSNVYFTKFLPESIDEHPDFISTSITMSVLSAGIDDIASDTGVIIGAIFATSVSLPIYLNVQISDELIATKNSDVLFKVKSVLLLVQENSISQFSLDLTCSSSGSTPISYSISNYNGATIPSWVSINLTSGILTVSAPEVDSNSEFNFYIDSVINGGSSIYKLIKLTIINCSISNCYICSSKNSSKCLTCDSGYTLYSERCLDNQAIATAKTIGTTTISIVGATAICIAISSLMNTSSMSSFWSMMNQVQMFFLLLLTSAFIPDNVQIVITGSEIALNLPEVFSFQNLGIYKSLIDTFNFDLSNSKLYYIGIKSDSTIYNSNSLITCLVLVVFLHLLIFMLNKLILRCRTDGKCSCLIKITKWILNKTFCILTFGYYIRTVLEMSQYLLISSIHEIYKFDTSNSSRITSLAFAIFLLTAFAAIVFFVLYLSLSSYKIGEDNHNKLEEFFSGLKTQKKFMISVVFLLIRRCTFVVLLIILECIASRITLGIYGSLLYMWIIGSNSMVVFLILIVWLIKMAISWIKGKCNTNANRNNDNTVKVIPKQNMKIKTQNIASDRNSEMMPNPSMNELREESKLEFCDASSNIQFKV